MLNKILKNGTETGASVADKINLVVDALNSLFINKVGTIASGITQAITTIQHDLIWNLIIQRNNPSDFTFNQDSNNFTIYKPGSYRFRSSHTVYSTTTNNIIGTISIVDAALGTTWDTTDFVFSITPGDETIVESGGILNFQSSDLPKTLKIVHRADGVGMIINSTQFIIDYSSSVESQGSHLALEDTDSPNCHPIGAITDLPEKLTGTSLNGEPI